MTQFAMATTTHEPSLAADDFIVSPSNDLAYDTVMRYPHWPEDIMSLVGPDSSGKTHLASILAQREGMPIWYQSEIENQDSAQLLGDIPAAILDDVDNMVATESLFHLINYARLHKKKLLFCSRAPLATLSWKWPDVRSRAAVIPTIALHAPDDILLQAVLVKFFTDRQLRVQPDVVAFIAKRIERSFEAAKSVVEQLDGEALRQQRGITIPLVRDMLQQGE